MALFAMQVGEARAADDRDRDIGSNPDWETFKQLGTSALKASLIDPDSAKIEWPYVARSGTLKALFGKKRSGFFTCGLVNAKNRMGGYTGQVYFLIMLRNESVVSLEIGNVDKLDAASVSCPIFIKRGFFPLASDIPATQPTLGFRIRAVPDGASVSEITPNGVAASVGLTQGMVISAVNGIRLKGFDDAAIVRVINATSGPITLSIIGHADIVVPSN